MGRLRDRSRVGLRKYGVTTERTDLNLVDWLRHAQEEAMDQAIYLERAIAEEMVKRGKLPEELKDLPDYTPMVGLCNATLEDLPEDWSDFRPGEVYLMNLEPEFHKTYRWDCLNRKMTPPTSTRSDGITILGNPTPVIT